MNTYKHLLISFVTLAIIGTAFGLYVNNKPAEQYAAQQDGQNNGPQATTSESIPAEVGELPLFAPMLVTDWVQKEDAPGVFADYTEITISDLRPYTDKKLHLKLSQWSNTESNPAPGNGEIKFNRETGELIYDPTESTWADNTLLSVYKIDPNMTADDVIKNIHIQNIRTYYQEKGLDRKEMEDSIEQIRKYCEATKLEGQDYYSFGENDEYQKLATSEQNSFGPCPIGTMNYIYDDFAIVKASKQRQNGVSVDEIVVR